LAQRWLQSPQWSGLLSVFTHAVPHCWSPTPHTATQLPPEHSGVAPVQAFGGLPHAVGLLPGSIQPPAPATRPGRQLHAEPVQNSVSLHLASHAPHWFTLLVVS